MVIKNNDRIMFVHTAVRDVPIEVNVNDSTTAEDVCIKVCKDLKIKPIARHLFALRLIDKNVFLSQNCLLSQLKSDSCVFRLRFKVPYPEKLEDIDDKAFDYFFHQSRKDFLNDAVPEICYENKDQKKKALGLAVTDMYRVMVEKGMGKSEVVQDYKKYFPKKVQKGHKMFLKSPIATSLSKIEETRLDSKYVKQRWMDQFFKMAPTNLIEEYTVLSSDGSHYETLLVRINPFHDDIPGIQIQPDGKKEWTHLCSIEDLFFVSAKTDNTVEVSRKNGIPSYMKFPNIPLMISFVSLLDGYYRLMVNWTFNLCKEVRTPSLRRLRSLNCHGPVGKEFSVAKLKEKCEMKPGSFILRESETNYDSYCLDVCYIDSAKEKPKPKVKTFQIKTELHVNEEGERKEMYVLSLDSSTYLTYPSIQALIAAHKAEGSSMCLQECAPPSEFEESCLLLCKLISSSSEDIYQSAKLPYIIKPSTVQQNESSLIEGRMCVTVHGIWKQEKGKEIDVVVKTMDSKCFEKSIQEFKEADDRWTSMAGQWAFLHSHSVVRTFGILCRKPISLVMEHLPLGPLDVYLKQYHSTIKNVDLVEACANLASALWHLEENGFVHGYIRCKSLLVAEHNASAFSVKLAHPGLSSYTVHDIHWIPPECYYHFESAQSMPSADVWACGTTMWEIFAYGEAIPESSNVEAIKKYYLNGGKLPCPPSCTETDVYRLMEECWEIDPNLRKKPQAVMRDINQIFYQVFNSRRSHSYAVAFPKRFREQADDTCSISGSEISMLSGATVETLIDSVGEDQLISIQGSVGSFTHSGGSGPFGDWVLGDSREHLLTSYESITPNISAMLSRMTYCTTTTSLESMSIFELGPDVNVVLQGRIGQGFYGEVFKGTLERLDGETELVAVKKLQTDALSTTLLDFEREINIMKTLEHPNIVQIKGVVHEPEISLVMEFVQHGSLKTYLKINKDKLQKKHLIKFALDVARGMDYLGQKNIVHRDLAARNILVVDENMVKISDFGLAQVMGQNDYYIMKSNRALPIPWYAPESLKDGKFSPRSDVWSYGVTLFEMFSLGEEPKLSTCLNDQDHHELLRVLESGVRLPCPGSCSQEIYVDLMAPCWKAESRDRPSFSDICDTIQKLDLSQV